MERPRIYAIFRLVILACVLGGCGPDSGDGGEIIVRDSLELIPLPRDTFSYDDGLPPATSGAPPPADVPEPPRHCDPNYTPCVPIDSDVDCAGGGGNGPSYVRGPVRVIGADVYRLDADSDGIGCDR